MISLSELNKLILTPSDSIKSATSIISKFAYRMVIVADENYHLLGVVTDQDIRSGLSLHISLDAPVSSIMNTNPKTVSLEHVDDCHNVLNEYNFLAVPIVKGNQIVSLCSSIDIDKPSEIMQNSVFLMAGGFGMRLRPLTKKTPKPLLKMGEKSILENLLYNLSQQGFKNIYISIHYKSEMIMSNIGDGTKWGIKIKYITEDIPLGTAGSLGFLSIEELIFPILVMNCDLVTDVNYGLLVNYHDENDSEITMCTRDYEFEVPYGVVDEIEGFVKALIEKPVKNFFVNAGIYAINKSIVETIDKDKYLDMTDLISQCISSNRKIMTYPLHEYWIDIGRIEDYNIIKDGLKNR